MAGHAKGWMSPRFLATARLADKAVGFIMEALNSDRRSGEIHVLVHSDHGVHGNHHMDPAPEVLTIPWIAIGPRIRKVYQIKRPITVFDTAPTIAHLLDVPLHYNWEGRTLLEIFMKP